LLSQVLVAFTVELDNEFERRMGLAGYAGARLSIVVWTNLMRFIGQDGILVRDLGHDAQVKFQLGCLERWGFVVMQAGRRPGWGSGRGIRADWVVRLTPKAVKAGEIWRPLFGEIEQRWERRFGRDEIAGLRRNLAGIADRLPYELPDGLPHAGIDPVVRYPSRSSAAGGESLPLATLLSRALLAFQIEFDSVSPVPLVLCANTIRVLSAEPIQMAEMIRLTGGSPETSDIGWQVKPFVLVSPDPTGRRGQVVSLSPRGLAVQAAYFQLIRTIEKRWEERFGKEAIQLLRESLDGLFDRLAEGMVAPAGTARAGDQTPALGRRDVGPAAKQRMRDLMAQTEAFVSDPAGSLPHFPAWDMNRGFGP